MKINFRFGRKLQPREWLLIVAAAVVVGGVPLVKRVVLPAIDGWRALHAEVGRMTEELAQLRRNLLLRDTVQVEFARLGDRAVQVDSDEITLSAFLRDVEAIAHKPSVTLVNMKPLPVEDAPTYKTYRVRLSVAGRLADVTQFVSELLGGPAITGLDGFSIRGVQDGRSVECNLRVWMVRLLPPQMQKRVAVKAKAKTAAAGKGGRDVH